MIRATVIVAALAGGLFVAPASASAEQIKVAYVNMARALNDVNDGKAAKNRLKKEFEAKQKKLDKMQKDLKAKKDAFESKKGMMKPDARAAQQEELQMEFMKLQQTYMQLQQELVQEESKVTQEIAGKLRNVIAKIGDRDAYHMVLDIGDTVLYYKRHRDITEQVVQEYNKQYGK